VPQQGHGCDQFSGSVQVIVLHDSSMQHGISCVLFSRGYFVAGINHSIVFKSALILLNVAFLAVMKSVSHACMQAAIY
jgi:hypothetical protein